MPIAMTDGTTYENSLDMLFAKDMPSREETDTQQRRKALEENMPPDMRGPPLKGNPFPTPSENEQLQPQDDVKDQNDPYYWGYGSAKDREGPAMVPYPTPKFHEIMNQMDELINPGSTLPANARPTAAELKSPYDQAQVEMGLNEQEKALYERHLKNLNGPGGVDNEDGSRSTLLTQISKYDDRYYLIPTVSEGKILDPGEKMSDTANKLAEKDGLDKYPSYATEEEAKARYAEMHKYLEKDTEQYQKAQAQFPALPSAIDIPKDTEVKQAPSESIFTKENYDKVTNWIDKNLPKAPGQELAEGIQEGKYGVRELLGLMLSTAMQGIGGAGTLGRTPVEPPPKFNATSREAFRSMIKDKMAAAQEGGEVPQSDITNPTISGLKEGSPWGKKVTNEDGTTSIVPDKKKLNQIERMWKNGNTYQEMADEFDVSRGSIASVVKQMGLKRWDPRGDNRTGKTTKDAEFSPEDMQRGVTEEGGSEGKPWTPVEDKVLKSWYLDPNGDLAEIPKMLGHRSEKAIFDRARQKGYDQYLTPDTSEEPSAKAFVPKGALRAPEKGSGSGAVVGPEDLGLSGKSGISTPNRINTQDDIKANNNTSLQIDDPVAGAAIDKSWENFGRANRDNLPLISPAIEGKLQEINPAGFKKLKQFELEMDYKYKQPPGRRHWLSDLTEAEANKYRKLYNDIDKIRPVNPLKPLGAAVVLGADPDKTEKNKDLTQVEGAVLGGGRVAEKLGMGGTALKLYNDIVQRGRTKPITEKDFQPHELDSIRDIVLHKESWYTDQDHITSLLEGEPRKKEGKIDYTDYKHINAEGLLENIQKPHNWPGLQMILGGFKYKIEGDNIVVTDKYDFNKDRGTKFDQQLPTQLETVGLSPIAIAAIVGRKRVSDESGKGVPVKIKIPIKKQED